MCRHTYTSLADPIRDFDALRPFVIELRRLQGQCKPFGRDYHALAIALEGLDSAAYHFTRRPHFYGAGGCHQ